jgi:hypothetical protein
MKVSASSFETAKDLCFRKWWFANQRDMPEGKIIAGADFGTAIHGVNERWLLADDQGNGPPLYPEGWNEGLDAADSALVRMLHEKAVELGVLVRRPGRAPEQWMNTPILVDDDVVNLTGKLDVVDLEGFEDHKSTKAKKWAKDEAGLTSDAAMLFYAVEWCKNNAAAIECKMRYNYFLKDPSRPETWPVEVRVTRAVVDHFRETQLIPTVRAMVACAKLNLPDEKWSEVEGPKSADACRAFGGCPYATICGGIEQPAAYRARVARILSNRTKETPVGIFTKPSAPAIVQTTIAPPTTIGAKPSIFAKRNSTPPASPPTTPGPAAPATPATAEPSTSPAPAVAVVAPKLSRSEERRIETQGLVPVPNALPWAYAACRACGGTGMHPTEKRPCKGCRTSNMLKKAATDEDFNISYDAAGNLVWSAKEGTIPATGSVPAIAEVTAPKGQQPVVPTVTDVAAVEPKKRAPRQKKQPEVAPDVKATSVEDVKKQIAATWPKDPDADVAPVPSPVVEELPFILLCGSGPEKVPAFMKVVSMADVFAEASTLVPDYWKVNAFERRDTLAALAGDLAARLKGHVVVAPRSGPDQDSLVQALKPFASIVVHGLS